MANDSGEFASATSVPNTISLRASSPGHLSGTGTASAAGWIYFRLALASPALDLAGDYVITFTADASCRGLPSDLVSRAYSGTIAPTHAVPPGVVVTGETSFDLVLANADLENDGVGAIGVAGNLAAFALFNDGYPFIVERIAGDRWLAITGYAEAVLTSAASTISVPFEGWIAHFDRDPAARAVPVSDCFSTNHRFSLARLQSREGGHR